MIIYRSIHVAANGIISAFFMAEQYSAVYTDHIFFIHSSVKEHLGCFCVLKSLSRVQLFATPWTVAYQAPPSMGFSRQEHWSGLPFLSPGDLPKPGIEPGSPALQTDALPSEPPGKPVYVNMSIPVPQSIPLLLLPLVSICPFFGDPTSPF